MSKNEVDSQARAEAQAKFQEGLAFQQQGQLAKAQEIYQEVLNKLPEHFDALHLSGVIAFRTRNPKRAIGLLGKALEIDPNNAAAHYHRGLALRDMGLNLEAIDSYDRAIALKADFAEAFYNRGNALGDMKQHQAAVDSYDRAIALKADFAEAFYNRGLALQDLKQHQPAIDSYNRVIAIKDDVAEVYYSRGNALADITQHQAAVDSYDRAIALKADYAEAYYNRGLALQDLERNQAAIDSYDRAIALKSDMAEAYYNRGNALAEIKQQQAALISYDRAIALKSDYAEAYNNRGVVLQDLKRHQAAIDSFERAIALKADYADAYNNLGNAFRDTKQYLAAIASYDRAMECMPDFEYLYGARLDTKMQICDWNDADAQIARLAEKIRRNEKAVQSFSVLALIGSPSLQRKAAELWVNDKHPPRPALARIAKRPRHKRIRIGYFSSDFHNHAIAYLIAELIERHDRGWFDVVAFSFGQNKEDEMRKRLTAAFDRFIDVRDKTDKEVALLSRESEIDIAIDLNGFTQDSRAGIFSHRAAPLQVNYLGYPGTMAAGYIDYLIADKTLIPAASQRHYSEKIAYLPYSYQVNDGKRSIADREFRRKELDLPESGFVFCCFNNNYKIMPETFDSWMRILKRVEGSVLWLIEDNPAAANNLRREAEHRSVSGERLIFAKRLPLAEHLARHRAADLFIDTLPYNAHTTASDALWAGLPVLTCTADAFASRVAASLLNAIAMPEMITATRAEYETLAVELATNHERLAQLRQKLERNRLTTPLFDARLFATHIEDAYSQMFERYCADLPPDHIHVRQ